MRLSIDPNGWVIHVTDFDIFNIDPADANVLKKLPYMNLLAVIHNKEKLTLEQYHHFSQQVFEGLNNDLPAKEKVFVEGTNKEVIRVTGRRDETGEMLGLFGMPEHLPWHCNEPGRTAEERPDALCLYAVEHTEGSATLFSNSIAALKDLRSADNVPNGLLENLDKIYCYYNYQGSTDNGVWSLPIGLATEPLGWNLVGWKYWRDHRAAGCSGYLQCPGRSPTTQSALGYESRCWCVQAVGRGPY